MELKVAPRIVIKSHNHSGSEKVDDIEEDNLEFFVHDESASSHKWVWVGFALVDLLQEQGPEEPVISSTGKQLEQVVAYSVTPEEMFLLLSTTIIERDAPPPENSILLNARDGERNKFIDPYDKEMSPLGVGGPSISLHHESLDGKKSRSRTPSANKADDSKLPHAKRPFTRSQIAQGVTGKESAVESTWGKAKVMHFDDDGEIYHVTS